MKIRVLADDEPSVTLESLTTPGTGILQEDGKVTRTREQIDLLLATAQDVLDPENEWWDQGRYVGNSSALAPGYCETSGCLAGHAMARASVPIRLGGVVGVKVGVVIPHGGRNTFELVGQTILGLTDNEAEDLFYAGNNSVNIRHYVHKIVARTRYVEA